MANAPILADTIADFDKGVLLQAGQLYALVLSNGNGTYNWAYSDNAVCYSDARGFPFTSRDRGNTWSRDIVDFYFTTYMVP